MSQYLYNYDYVARVLTLGDSSVGKSAIVLQFCEKRFGEEYPCTIGKLHYFHSFLLNS